ncbi:PQQ-like beta-propeller repeat protein [Pseudotabrizicola sp. L79]|uniref:PQQ-like beta-propeller repeat protein n=1 Tax=Pseudotabrizicola sp. L79 TaxID=3118402 RepID=UPI002F94F960
MTRVAKSKLNLGITALASTLFLIGCERELILQGERFPVRADLQASVRAEGEPAPVAPPDRPENQSVAIALPAASANAEWTHRGGNVQHTSPHGQLSATPQRIWSANIGTGSSRKNRVAASPVVSGGRIFTIDSKSLVVATGNNGATLWKADLTAKFDRGGDLSGGGLAFGEGALFAATAYGELVAIEPSTGKLLWRQRLDSPVAGAPTVDGGTVYVSTRDGAGFAVDAKNGLVKWTIAGASSTASVMASASPAIVGRNVVFPFASGELLAALRLNGTRVWSAPVTGQRPGRGYQGLTDVTGDPVVVGGTIYAGTAAGRTAAIDAGTGARVWTAVEGALNPPLVVGGSVFVVNDEARLVRLDAATGAVIWSAEMPYFVKDKPKRHKAIHAHYGPVLAGGRIAVVSSDGLLRLFNATNGAMVQTIEIPGGAAAAPALAGGVLYVVSASGQLHAFR